MTVFKSQTRTDLHNLIMWLYGHLISLTVCWALLSSLPFRVVTSSLTLRFQVLCTTDGVRRTPRLCVCLWINVRVGCQAPFCWPVSLPAASPPECGWVQTSLFKWAASSRFKTTWYEVLAPFLKNKADFNLYSDVPTGCLADGSSSSPRGWR